MSNYDLNALGKSIMDLLTDFANEYDAVESVDYATRCAALPPGSTVPDKKGIELKENKRHLDNYAYHSSSKIAELCEEQRNVIRDLMCIPPSEEALRMMQAIQMRGGDVGETEVQALSARFGDNYSVRQFIAKHSERSPFEPDYVDEYDAALQSIDQAQQLGQKHMSTFQIEQSPFGKDSRLAILKQQLEDYGMIASDESDAAESN